MNELKNITILQKAGVFALVCGGLLCLSGVYYLYESNAHANSKMLPVAGKGEVEVHATTASINSQFVGDGNTSAESIKNLSDFSTKVFAALADAGIKKDDIKTEQVSTNPKYEYCYSYSGNMPIWCKGNPNSNRISGYESSQSFTITIKDNKELVEKILGLMPTLGARNVNGPNWQVDNKAALAEARKKAVDDARAKAQAIADSLGMRLGDVFSYSEDNGAGGYPVPMMYSKTMSARAEMAQAMDVSIPVSEGTDKVTINVNITYELR